MSKTKGLASMSVSVRSAEWKRSNLYISSSGRIFLL